MFSNEYENLMQNDIKFLIKEYSKFKEENILRFES